MKPSRNVRPRTKSDRATGLVSASTQDDGDVVVWVRAESRGP